MHLTTKIRLEYEDVCELPPSLAAKHSGTTEQNRKINKPSAKAEDGASLAAMKLIEDVTAAKSSSIASGPNGSTALTLWPKPSPNGGTSARTQKNMHTSLVRRQNVQPIKPSWHAPWKLMRVISGHLGWVRSVAVEPGNQWFCTGAGDRTIKIWDLASGNLRLTLTGHISTVRGLAVSPRHPYLFSCGEDKMVKCWDLESNRVIRHYHGHLSGVYSLTLHPILDVLVTAGRDGVARVTFI